MKKAKERTATEIIVAVSQALRRRDPQPVVEEEGLAPCCPYCQSAAWMTNADEEPNSYCGLCGQRLDWAHPENPDEEEAEEEKT